MKVLKVQLITNFINDEKKGGVMNKKKKEVRTLVFNGVKKDNLTKTAKVTSQKTESEENDKFIEYNITKNLPFTIKLF